MLRDGWYHSGDLGYFDEQGYVYIVDRAKARSAQSSWIGQDRDDEAVSLWLTLRLTVRLAE